MPPQEATAPRSPPVARAHRLKQPQTAHHDFDQRAQSPRARERSTEVSPMLLVNFDPLPDGLGSAEPGRKGAVGGARAPKLRRALTSPNAKTTPTPTANRCPARSRPPPQDQDEKGSMSCSGDVPTTGTSRPVTTRRSCGSRPSSRLA